MSDSESTSCPTIEAPQSRYAWEQIREVRFQIADEMDRMVGELESGTAAWLKPVSAWMRGSANYEEALAQPMVLSICLPLSKKLRERAMVDAISTESQIQKTGLAPSELAPTQLTESAELFSASEIQQAVRWGFRQVIGRQKTVSWRIFGLLLYPLVTILIAWALWVAACFLFFPQIQESLEEFNIALPRMTVLLFSSATTVREWWGAMILIPVVYIVLLIALNYIGSNRTGNSGSWLDRKLIGKRRAIANWSWHLSLLLDWGLATRTAVMVAGMCSHRGWLQQCCLDWIGESFGSIPGRRSQAAPSSNLNRTFLSQTRFQLVNCAMALPDGEDKILLLREISTYYQEKSSSFTEWMIAWLSTLLVWLSFGMIILILFAIYSPLLSFFRMF